MKLSSYSWSIYDGSRKESELSSDEIHHAIRKNPSMVEYFGYCFFFMSCWVGPAFDFRTYIDFINYEGLFKSQQISPYKFTQTFWTGIALFGINVWLGRRFSFESCFRNDFNLTFIPRLAQMHIAAVIYRLKFAGAWKITESACSLTRISYNGINPKTNLPEFNRAENINLIGVELAENAKQLTDNWNIYTNKWLKHVVYSRIADKNFATVVTYFTSGFWHGFYPGYYLGFISGALVTACGRSLRKNLRPLFLSGPLKSFKFIYDILGRILTVAVMSYMFVPVGMRDFNPSIHVWKETYFIGHLICIGTIILLDFMNLGTVFRNLSSANFKKD